MVDWTHHFTELLNDGDKRESPLWHIWQTDTNTDVTLGVHCTTRLLNIFALQIAWQQIHQIPLCLHKQTGDVVTQCSVWGNSPYSAPTWGLLDVYSDIKLQWLLSLLIHWPWYTRFLIQFPLIIPTSYDDCFMDNKYWGEAYLCQTIHQKLLIPLRINYKTM